MLNARNRDDGKYDNRVGASSNRTGFAFRSARIMGFGAICFLVPPALQVMRVIM